MSKYNEAKTEILDMILEVGEATAQDIASFTDRSVENAAMLMLIYHRYGLLSRYRGSRGAYVYSITKRGVERLAWLLS